MKTVLGYAAAVAGLFALALACTVFTSSSSSSTNRYHQHRDASPPAGECVQTAGRTTAQNLCTHLPVVEIVTGGQEIPGNPIRNEQGATVGYTTAPNGEKTIGARMRFFQKEGQYHRVTDEPDYESAVNIRIRGNSSRYFDKKNYFFELLDKSGDKRHLPLLGMAEGDDWTLHGPFLDKTLMRNYLSYNIAGEMMDWAPNVRFCEVVLDGRYQGVYVLTEIIGRGDDSRVNITKTRKNAVYSSYIIRMDRPDAAPLQHIVPFTNYSLRNQHYMMIEYPPLRKLTPELSREIKDDFSAFEKALYSFDYDSKEYGYKSLIDTRSFVDYLILNEFTCNYDAGNLSTYLYKDVGGKLKMAVWDFNNAYDNYHSPQDLQGFQFQYNVWFYMLMKDEDFTEAVIRRYHELRKTVLSEEYLFSYIDETAAYLGDAVARNEEVWGYAYGEDSDLLTPHSRNPRSYEEAIRQMKDFIAVRGRWLDQNIEVIRQYSHESKVKKFNH